MATTDMGDTKLAVRIGGGVYRHISEAAKMAGVSERTLYRRIKAGRVNGVKLGLSWYVPESELKRVMKYEQQGK